MENTNSWKSQIQKNTNFEKSYNLYADKNDLRKIEVIKDYKNQALGNCPANCPAPKLTRINFMPATGLLKPIAGCFIPFISETRSPVFTLFSAGFFLLYLKQVLNLKRSVFLLFPKQRIQVFLLFPK